MLATGWRKSGRGRASWRGGFAVLCAALGLVLAGSGASAAPTETVVYSFTGGGDGADPAAGLIADSAGNLYGTTAIGGGSPCFGDGCGVVFKLSPGGTETVLYSFTGGTDGAFPAAGLIADSAGNLYGTTVNGFGGAAGAVFKLSPGGTVTVLYSFSDGSDGGFPAAGVIADSAGNLYGTTSAGGGSGCGGGGCGVVFKLSPGGTETVLHTFTGGSDGGDPLAGLIADSAGNLYGTTASGGASNNGVVFKLAPGATETVLYSFKGGSDGSGPQAGLIADSAGNLYGTTALGGASNNGVVFKLAPGGTETVLYSFKGGTDGGIPSAGLIADGAGNLYGTTAIGGVSRPECSEGGCGVVFKLAPGGTETVLHSFTGGSDGFEPLAGLIADGAGNLYGTTLLGGGAARGNGVVFKLTGTGFVTTTPFLAFSSKLQLDIDANANANPDAFALESSFTLSSTAPAIDPVTQAVALKVGPFSATIPPGSFKKQLDRSFTFAGKIGGVTLNASITPAGTLRYAFLATAEHPNLTGTKNPVTVKLTIGRDSGTKSVTARIFH